MFSERKAAHMVQAQQIADEALERARAGDYSVFGDASGYTSVSTGDLPRATGLIAWEPYPSGSSTSDLKLVAVNVSWQWAGPSSGNYNVVTLISVPRGG
jgi:hypothetical protein